MFYEQTEKSSLSIAEKDRRLKATHLNQIPGPGGEEGSGQGREF